LKFVVTAVLKAVLKIYFETCIYEEETINNIAKCDYSCKQNACGSTFFSAIEIQPSRNDGEFKLKIYQLQLISVQVA